MRPGRVASALLENLAARERHGHIVLRERAAELGALDVAEDPDVAPRGRRGRADPRNQLLELARTAVGSVEPEDVDARGDELLDHDETGRRRAERRDHLAFAVQKGQLHIREKRLESLQVTRGRVLGSKSRRAALHRHGRKARRMDSMDRLASGQHERRREGGEH